MDIVIFILVASLFIIRCSIVVASKLCVMCDRFKDSRNVWSSSQARDDPQRVRNNRWSHQQFRLFCVQFLQNNKRKETSLLIIGQFQLNKHWPGHPLVCLETPLKSAFATRKYILVVMISLILDKKNPTSCSQTFVNPASRVAVKSHFPFRLPITKSPTIFWSNPGSRKYPSKLWGPESTVNTPSQSLCRKKNQMPRLTSKRTRSNLPPGEWISRPIPSCFPHSHPPPQPPHEIYIERCTRLGYCSSKCFKSSDTFLLLRFCCSAARGQKSNVFFKVNRDSHLLRKFF